MQNFIIALLICSVTMTALALFYMAISPLIKNRYSEKGRYYAWLIIIVGLIIPFRPQWGNAIVQIDVPSATTLPVQTGNEMPNFDGTHIFNFPNIVPIENTVLPSVTMTSISLWQIAAVVWLIGVIVFFAYHTIRHFRFLKMVKRWSESVTDERTLALLQNTKTEMGISKKISLYQYSDIGSPLMFGFVNTRILLPTLEPAEDELRFIFKHELAHYKRKDLWYKMLVLIATAIHWFNTSV